MFTVKKLRAENVTSHLTDLQAAGNLGQTPSKSILQMWWEPEGWEEKTTMKKKES